MHIQIEDSTEFDTLYLNFFINLNNLVHDRQDESRKIRTQVHEYLEKFYSDLTVTL